MRALGEDLIQSAYCPHNRRTLQHRNTRDVHTYRKGYVSTQWRSSHMQGKDRSLRENQLYWYLILDFWPPYTWGNKCLWSQSPSLWYFTMAGFANKCKVSCDSCSPSITRYTRGSTGRAPMLLPQSLPITPQWHVSDKMAWQVDRS